MHCLLKDLLVECVSMCFETEAICSLDRPPTSYITDNLDLELLILLLPSLGCWHYRHEPSCPVYVVLCLELRVSYLVSEHSSN